MNPSRAWRIVLYGTLALFLCTGVYIIIVLSSGLPTLQELENPRQDLATQVLSADGVVLDHFATTRRTYVPYDSIPSDFIHALIATEDRAFRDHWGVHVMRIFKAAVKNVAAMETREGASTITQQLALNLYFKREQSLARKIREAWTALQIERTYTKNEILEMYANTVYYGKGAFGLRVASNTYFNKEPMQLTTAECAYLVGLFKAPERYNRDDSAGIARRNLILSMMRDEGYITPDVYAKASTESLNRPAPTDVARGIAPHFVEMIRQQLGRDGEWAERLAGHDLYRDGLVITTTLNSRVQRYANEAVAEHLSQYQKLFDNSWSWTANKQVLSKLVLKAIRQRPEYISASASERDALVRKLSRNKSFVDSVRRITSTIQAGVVVIDAHTGAILGMVGASPQAMKLDPAARYSLNHVTQIRRQPGSSFKPFLYASALESGLSPDSLVDSGPFSITLPSGTVWSPRGASKDGGMMSLRQGLKLSVNTVAARLITGVTNPIAVVDLCRRMGITSTLHAVPSIALGAVEVSPLELTAAYIPFVNMGLSVPPVAITRIEDKLGNVLWEAKLPTKVEDALSAKVAYSMMGMMRGVVDGGTGSRVRQFYKGDAAGKTGTTNDFADAWFVGFTPKLVAGVWTGFDDRRVHFTGDYGQGGRAAAPIWGRLMQKVSADPNLPYRASKFPTQAASEDSVRVEDIINPPNELSSTQEDSDSGTTR
ncbi:MAG: PBP1A family penicillin-binding protein [Bradyrhizobiaceae bacterium]|nr:PBP1A family penicillin-binding protein [Bradyrhizobiaceae bacterium]